MMSWILNAMDSGFVPDALVRAGIRALLRRRIRREKAATPEARSELKRRRIEAMKRSPVAPVPEKANEQHYEVPAAFFQLVLGRHLKYSCCDWSGGVRDLDQAEETMLALTCERAAIEDGMDVLELGCGWGSLTLWMASHYPASRITAVNNSESQADFIRSRARKQGLKNIDVITRDMNDFSIDRRFDRIVSVEMFEHMRNYRELLKRIASWTRRGGKLFVHIFCHREFLYPFEDRGPGDWMARHFFTGGLMPSEDWFTYFQEDFSLERKWPVNGTHYARSAEAWIENMDTHRHDILKVFTDCYGPGQAKRWFHRWRIFFMACEALFGFKKGGEWYVCHYLFNLSSPA
jgi:cyclopropane-fatty-acyl-phospholipid synthase